MAEPVKTIVTKAKFAEMKKRVPSAISNWIAEGKITREALVGDGTRAKIWVEQAERDLNRSLDVSQQNSQDHPVMASTASAAESHSPASPELPLTEDAANLQRLRKAQAETAEQNAIAARRKNAVEQGIWIRAADAAREWGSELAKIISGFETFLFNSLARTIAEKYNLDYKILAVEMRQEFRKFRSDIAAETQQQLDAREAELAAEESEDSPDGDVGRSTEIGVVREGTGDQATPAGGLERVG